MKFRYMPSRSIARVYQRPFASFIVRRPREERVRDPRPHPAAVEAKASGNQKLALTWRFGPRRVAQWTLVPCSDRTRTCQAC